MSKKKLIVGAKVTVYRIPKRCDFWFSPEMDCLLDTPTRILPSPYPEFKDIYIEPGYVVPRSCVKAL